MFLILEEISQSGRYGESNALRISLRVSTLFLDEPTPPVVEGTTS